MNDMKEKAMGAIKVFLERKGYEIVDEAWQGPEGIGGIDLVAVDEDGTLVFVDATVRIGTDGFPEAHRARGLREALATRWLAGNCDDYADTPVRFDEVASTIDLVDQNEMLLREQRLKFALDDASGSYDVCLIDCSPAMRRLAFNAYLAAAEGGMVVIPVKLDSTVMRGTALTVEATRSIADALRMPTPRWKILRTCVPGRMTNAEATGAAVLDGFFPGEQFETVIHASSKVCEGSWQWKPVAAFEPGSRPARDYEALADEVSRELA